VKKENYIEEDEMDLRELFKIIWGKRSFIVIFTFVVTLLGIVYVLLKTPIYEVKSVVRIGYLNDTLVEDSKVLEKKLKLVFGVDRKTNNLEKHKAIVSNISTVRRVENFLEISTQAFSNELAIKKNKEVVNFLKNEYKYKIDEFILRTNINIKKLEEKILYIEKVEKVNLERNIEKIKTQSIPKIDGKIELIKTQSIPKIDKKIELIKNVEIKSIENKLEFNTNKLNEYQVNLIKVSKQKSLDNTQNMLMSMQILNTQNLILNIQNTIENLKKEKENLLNIDIKELETKKENLLNIDVENLKLQKENYKNENIRKLEIDLNLGISEKIEDLRNNIKLEKFKLTNSSVKNSEMVGEIEVNSNPIKPKKIFIVVTAFITGLILSIFIVFFINFIILNKEEKI